MKKALLLHWRWGDSNQIWFPWLKKELEELWFEVIIPDLLNTNLPVFEEQFKNIKQYSSLWEWDIIIWHSLGCQLALQFIEKYLLSKIKVIFVAPSYPNLANELWEEFLWDNFNILSKYFNISNSFKKLNNIYFIFLSDNDNYINQLSAQNYYNQLENVSFRFFKNMWHFNLQSNVFNLPEILEYIKIPYFESIWIDKPRGDKIIQKRANIYVILEDFKKNNFWVLDWKKLWWKSFIVWWIDKWESFIESAKREVIEETWYNDFWEIKILDFELSSKFYARHKDVNRLSVEKYVYIKLNSMQNIGVNEKEIENHNFIWLKKEEVEIFINLDNHKYVWKLFNEWKIIDEEFLKTLNTFKWFI